VATCDTLETTAGDDTWRIESYYTAVPIGRITRLPIFVCSSVRPVQATAS